MDLDGPEAVLTTLDPEQREVALAVRGPVCVIAGAGTGKTRAIAHRIAYAVRAGVVNPSHVLAVTFTTRAAGELRARLRELDGAAGGGMERVTARTFHAAALRQLIHFWPRTVGGPAPGVLDSKAGLLMEAARRTKVRPSVAELRDVAAEIEWSKVMQVRPEDYCWAAATSGRAPPLRPDTVAGLFAIYEQLRRERHLVDFESVLELTAAILTAHPLAAAEVRDRYRYFVIDEYQDVNPLQKLLLDTWIGGRDEVCVVGDPRQTIYSFTGATSAYLTGFPAEYPDATLLRLVRNYRSAPQVVDLANRLTGASGGRPAIKALAGRAHGDRARAGAVLAEGAPGGNALGDAGLAGPPLVAQQRSGPEPEFTEYEDEECEATAVAVRARQFIMAGVLPRQIAVLVRANSQTERFERAFAEAGVPCQVRGAERFFARPEVRQAVGLLRAAAKGHGAATEGAPAMEGRSAAQARASATAGGSRAVVGASPVSNDRPDGEPDPAVAGRVPGPVTEVWHVLSGLGLTREPPAARGAARERWESLAALAQLTEDFCAAFPAAALSDVVGELIRRAAIEHAPEVEGVTVASLHAAKGLEWDVVFLPGLTEGNLPIIHASTDEAVAEERRLLYVGVTRARQYVLLSWPLARSAGSRRACAPSRFLDGLRPKRRQPRAGVPDGAPGASSSRADAPPLLDAAGEALLERLREWRREVARSAGVPAYVVFTDETLRRIAHNRPATGAALAAVPGVGPVKLGRYGGAVLAICTPPRGHRTPVRGAALRCTPVGRTPGPTDEPVPEAGTQTTGIPAESRS